MGILTQARNLYDIGDESDEVFIICNLCGMVRNEMANREKQCCSLCAKKTLTTRRDTWIVITYKFRIARINLLQDQAICFIPICKLDS